MVLLCCALPTDDAAGSVAEYVNHANHREETAVSHPQYTQPPVQQPVYHPPPQSQPTQHVTQTSSGYGHVPPPHQPGKIADYDPLSGAPRNSPYSARQASTLIYSSGRGAGTDSFKKRMLVFVYPCIMFLCFFVAFAFSSINSCCHNKLLDLVCL